MRIATLAVLLAACGSSHQLDDAPAPDGGPAPDLSVPSADLGAPDGFVRTPASCTIETGERIGEPCFCNGPLAYRDGYLYRQSVGIEVYAADGGELTLLRTIEERPSAQGGLTIAAGHLVSLLDFAEDGENVAIYALDDPASPTRVGGFQLPHDAVVDLAVDGDRLLIASRSVDASAITWLDLSVPAAPTERWILPTEGRVISVAVSEAGAFVIDERGEPGESEQWLTWHDGAGALVDETLLVGRRWRRTVEVHEGALYLTGPTERIIERFSLEARLTPVDALDADEGPVGGQLLLRGYLAMLSNPILVADVRAPMRELALTESPIGDMHHLAAPDGPLEWVYGSGGNGLVAARVSCE